MYLRDRADRLQGRVVLPVFPSSRHAGRKLYFGNNAGLIITRQGYCEGRHSLDGDEHGLTSKIIVQMAP